MKIVKIIVPAIAVVCIVLIVLFYLHTKRVSVTSLGIAGLKIKSAKSVIYVDAFAEGVILI